MTSTGSKPPPPGGEAKATTTLEATALRSTPETKNQGKPSKTDDNMELSKNNNDSGLISSSSSMNTRNNGPEKVTNMETHTVSSKVDDNNITTKTGGGLMAHVVDFRTRAESKTDTEAHNNNTNDIISNIINNGPEKVIDE